jgi:hypothetical protein
MNDWIEINLPYSKRNSELTYPEYPDLSQKCKEEFGLTIDELNLTLKSPNDNEQDTLGLVALGEYWTHYEKFRKEIESSIIVEFPAGLEEEDLVAKMTTRLASLNDNIVNKVLEYKKFIKKYNAWEAEQTEVIEFNKLITELEEAHREKMRPLSFCGLGLNKPGVLIEVSNGVESTQYLIGDINIHRGVCDDCVAFGDEDIVTKYKIVWEDTRNL